MWLAFFVLALVSLFFLALELRGVGFVVKASVVLCIVLGIWWRLSLGLLLGIPVLLFSAVVFASPSATQTGRPGWEEPGWLGRWVWRIIVMCAVYFLVIWALVLFYAMVIRDFRFIAGVVGAVPSWTRAAVGTVMLLGMGKAVHELKKRFPKVSAMIEIVAGGGASFAVFIRLSPFEPLSLEATTALSGAMYIFVRGLDNWSKGNAVLPGEQPEPLAL